MRRILVLPLILLLAAPALAADFPAHVVGISDGDTTTVLKADKTQIRVRLYGIDAPETGQDFASRAEQAASELAFGKDVTVKAWDKDRYGRTVAEVILPDGRSLNGDMVRGGMAWWYRHYAPADEGLGRLEAEAEAAHRGLWSRANPTPPWEWRKGVGVPLTAGVIGNRNSHVYHKPICPCVGRMRDSNRVTFGTAELAEAAGYRKAGDCR